MNLVPPEVFDPIQRSPRAKLISSRSMSIYLFQFNLVDIPNDRPLADKRVRQAVNLAIDRKTLSESIMKGAAVPVATFCPEGSFGCDDSIPLFPHDPERARALLREAGWPEGFEMTLATTSGATPADRDLALAVAEQLGAVGIRARVVIKEIGVLIREIIERKTPEDAVFNRFTDFVGFAGGIPSRAFHSKGAFSLWVPGNREFDRLLELPETTLDEARARELYRQAQLLYKDEVPGITLFTGPNVNGVHRELEWTPRPDLLTSMFEALWKRR